MRERSALLFCVAVAALLGLASDAHAQATPNAVLELRYTPAARAQVAVWLEDDTGHYLTTVRLTEAVAFRGIGNRPGASQMNSGYRWPYGRREGVLPIWASRRAAAANARYFPRVIFQSRVEGFASRTVSDQSPDNYYCLSFMKTQSSRDALDAVTCASVFTSDKGRYLTTDDLAKSYSEPYEATSPPHTGTRQPLSIASLYPPRMDLTRCTVDGCFDHVDVAHYAQDARSVMPEIDAVTAATPQGGTEQSVLFTIPASWPAGAYVAWIEINVEGDYNATWNDKAIPTPVTPSSDWDSWAMSYGYPYRGQPSVAFRVPFTLAAGDEQTFSTAKPYGSASWDNFGQDFGRVRSLDGITDDPQGAEGSGADRLALDMSGQRFTVKVKALTTSSADGPPPNGALGGPTVDRDAGAADGRSSGGASGGDPRGAAGTVAAADGGASSGNASHGTVIAGSGQQAVGAIYGLVLRNHKNPLRSHTWAMLSFRAAQSLFPLHGYEIRIAMDPIVDETSFIRNGRPAKSATDAAEGATLLTLPTDAPAGQLIEGAFGALVQQTHYYVGVRATDELNRSGPISVAEITTTARRFATVTPCFVASAAYGTPLASEIGVLRRLRDRYLMNHRPGRALVTAYYALGPTLGSLVRDHAGLRAVVREALTPILALARHLP